MLIVRDALSFPTIDNNLIPPLIMRQVGINVRNTPNFQAEYPLIDDCSAYVPKENLRTPLTFHDVISYFPSINPQLRN